MRILIISQYFFPENFRINDLCLGLKDNGHEVTVLTGRPNYPSGKFYEGYTFLNKRLESYHGIKVYRSHLIPRGSASGFRLFLNYISFVIFAPLRILSINGNFDRVFVYAPSPITVGFVGIFASIYFRAKPFLWVHDLWPESVKDAGGINNKIILSLINFMTKSIYYFYDNILVQSPSFKNYLVDQGVKSEKIIYYPYYAESFYNVVDKNEKIENMFPKGLNIVFAGNIGVAQSFDTIIEAVKIALNDVKSLNIIVLGEGRDKERILKKIKKNNLNNFYFMGSFPPESMPEYFASADALLVSLKKSKIFSSTIPGKLQSYLACGKPIIASLDGIGAKIVSDASCGFSSDAEDFQGLAQSIIAFSKLKDVDRLKLGENGRKYYENEFERKKLLSKLIDIFEK
ncbi:MAG: glycosyltransferase family 4 protein [Pelagibacteraceae bacterium]|nr:glycosyltransferase family 4 protein [Pelagibacteraceae bacterium]MBT7623861.1 glycosyltransferase family 4 protein [Flavobacteriaceae bacterium]